MTGEKYYATVAADVVLFALKENRLHVLLIQRGHPPFEGMWAFPGGIVEPHEPLAAAARRELAEETGITDVPYLRQLAAFGDPERDPRGRVISIAYWGLLPQAAEVRGGDDAARARWWPTQEPPPLAFDHAQILDCALQQVRTLVEQDQRLLFHLVSSPFTLTELQRALEAILGHSVDKRNFRRQILARGWLEPATVRSHQGPGRPAQEYRPRPDACLPSPDDRCV